MTRGIGFNDGVDFEEIKPQCLGRKSLAMKYCIVPIRRTIKIVFDYVKPTCFQ